MQRALTGAALLTLAWLALPVDHCAAQSRDFRLAETNGWIYNDLDKAIEKARRLDQPLMVVLRCPP